jgi:hypothetical protein
MICWHFEVAWDLMLGSCFVTRISDHVFGWFLLGREGPPLGISIGEGLAEMAGGPRNTSKSFELRFFKTFTIILI